jgi:lysophospholipase L1-like esterase
MASSDQETTNSDEASPASEERAPLSLKKKLIFTGFLILLLIPTLELLGRIAGYPSGAMRSFQKIRIKDMATFDKVPGIFQPGFSGAVLWPKELAYNVKINQLGMRGPEVKLEKSPGVFRILCIGDSNTFCLYSSEDATWPEVMRGLFATDKIKTEMLNSGCPGWSTADQVRFLEEKALDKVKPDMVLHMFCGNDPFDILDVAGQSGKFARQVKRVKKHGFFRGLRDSFSSNTAIGEMESRIRVAIKGLSQGPKQFVGQGPESKPLPLPIADDKYKKYQQSYANMARLCKSKNVPLVTVCFPHHKNDASNMPGLEDRIAKTSEKNGAGFLPIVRDFAKLPEQDSLYNIPYDYHASPKGNPIIGKLIWQEMKAQSLGPYSK